MLWNRKRDKKLKLEEQINVVFGLAFNDSNIQISRVGSFSSEYFPPRFNLSRA